MPIAQITIYLINNFVKYNLNLKTGDNVYIPIKSLHRLENTGSQNLKIIEIQIGQLISEDDIIRIEDDYGRA